MSIYVRNNKSQDDDVLYAYQNATVHIVLQYYFALIKNLFNKKSRYSEIFPTDGQRYYIEIPLPIFGVDFGLNTT